MQLPPGPHPLPRVDTAELNVPAVQRVMGASVTVTQPQANPRGLLRYDVPQDYAGPLMLEIACVLSPRFDGDTYAIATYTWGPSQYQQTRRAFVCYVPVSSVSPNAVMGRARIPIVAQHVDVSVSLEGSSQILSTPDDFTNASGIFTGTIVPGVDGQKRAAAITVPPFSNLILQARNQVQQRAANLLGVQGYAATGDGTDRYLMFFDTAVAVAPLDGAKPRIAWKVPDGVDFFFTATDSNSEGIPFGRSIYWAVSSTADTLTYDGSAKFRVDTTVEL